MIVLMKENVLLIFSKRIWSHSWKIFKTGQKKNLRGDLRTKGGTIGKNFFQNMFLSFENDCFDERKRFFIFWNEFEAIVQKFSKLVGKKFKGWPQDQRGDHWKKFFSKCFYAENHCFYHIFKAFGIWFKTFDERKFFETCFFMKIFWIKTFFQLEAFGAYWKIFKTGREKI